MILISYHIRIAAVSAFMLALSCLYGCHRAEESVVGSPEYDSVQECFNGMSIVSLGGRYGIVTDDGHEVIPVEYDDAWFLADGLIAAFSGNDCELHDVSTGRIGVIRDAAGQSPLALIDTFERLRRQWYLEWDEVVCGYERLCRMMSEGADPGSVKVLADSLSAKAQTMDGGRLQSEQIDRIKNAYRRAMR